MNPMTSDTLDSSSIDSLIEKTADLLERAMKSHGTETWNSMEKRLVNGALLMLCERYGSQIEVAQKLRIPRATLNARVKQAQLMGMGPIVRSLNRQNQTGLSAREGEPENIKGDPKVQEAYLGGAHL